VPEEIMMEDPVASVMRLKRPKAERKTLTEANVKAAPARAQRYWIGDATLPGLALRISPSGERAYYVRGRVGGGRSAPTLDFHLGVPAQMSLAQARREAVAVIAQIEARDRPADAKGRRGPAFHSARRL
jgi:hypothetical protein